MEVQPLMKPDKIVFSELAGVPFSNRCASARGARRLRLMRRFLNSPGHARSPLFFGFDSAKLWRCNRRHSIQTAGEDYDDEISYPEPLRCVDYSAHECDRFRRKNS